jgi:glycosyltransferase involved in cell wall biosynthesis
VKFTELVDDVKAVIAASAACVVPLRLGGGTRIKVLEALALGTPVVATSKAVEGIDLVPDIHVLLGNTADQFAAQVLRVFDETDLAARLAASGRSLIESTYAWPRIAASLSARIMEMAS